MSGGMRVTLERALVCFCSLVAKGDNSTWVDTEGS